MRPGPKKPGESAADYNARIKAMEQKFLNRPQGPKTGGGKPSTPPTGPTRGNSVGGTRPGESKTDYLARIRDMKAAGVKFTTPGRTGNDIMVRPGTKPTPPTPPKPRPGGGRGTAAAPGYGGGKPRRMMSGGMVKGKK